MAPTVAASVASAGYVGTATFMLGTASGYTALPTDAFCNIYANPWSLEGAGTAVGLLCSLRPDKLCQKAVGATLGFVVREATELSSDLALKSVKWLNRAGATVAKESTKQALSKTSEIGRRQLFQGISKKEVLCLDKLSEAGKVMDRGGLTKAGRSLDKHGGRIGSSFPKAVGNPISKNRQGQFQLDDVLTTPGSVIQHSYRGRFGPTLEVTTPNSGRGVVYDSNGNFLFFKE